MLVDTNLLLRTLQPQDPLNATANAAISILRSRGQRLYLVPQNLIELWAVVTRPLAANGLGLSASAALDEIDQLERLFSVLPETPDFYATWKRLVVEHQVTGKSVHDARIVAAMRVHRVSSILTFDRSGFARYPDIEVVDPIAIATSLP